MPADLWASPTWQGIRKRGDRQMGRREVAAFLRRPGEELYDLRADPDELRNLAGDRGHAEALADLRRRLRAWQEQTNDPWTILHREENGAYNR